MNPRLRSFALGMLLLVLPFSGIRVICVESPAAVTSAGVQTEAEVLTDCERLCPFRPPASVQGPHADAASSAPDEESDCALSSDAAALQMLGTIAVLRPSVPLLVPDAQSEVIAAAPRFYSEPSLAHLAPPPKHQVL